MTDEKTSYQILCRKIARMRPRCSPFLEDWHKIEEINFSESLISEAKAQILLSYLDILDKLLDEHEKTIDVLFNAFKKDVIDGKIKKEMEELFNTSIGNIKTATAEQCKKLMNNIYAIIFLENKK